MLRRQWVLALPKRLRYFVHRDAELAGRVLNVWLRALVTAYAGQPLPGALEPPGPRPAHRPSTTADEPTRRSPASYLWAALLARIYDCFPLVCPKCGNNMALVAFIIEPAAVKPILEHLGLPTEPPRVASSLLPRTDPPRVTLRLPETPPKPP